MFGNLLPNIFGDVRQDVNTLIQRKWDQDRFQDQREDSERAMQVQNEHARAMWERNYEAQKEFAKHGVQWRTEDAQAAGLHPLFALSGSGAAFSPTMAVGGYAGSGSGGSVGFLPSSMGQNVSRAAKASLTEEQRRMQELQEMLVMAQIHERDSAADLNSARAAQIRGQPNASNGLGSADPNVAVGLPAGGENSAAGLIRVKPDESTSYASSDIAVTAAKRPMWSMFRVHEGPGGEWVLPHAQTGAEAFESIGEGLAPLWLTIRENMARDPEFLRKNKRYVPFYDEVRGGLDFLDEFGRSLGRLAAEVREHYSPVHKSRIRRPYIREDYRWSNRR